MSAGIVHMGTTPGYSLVCRDKRLSANSSPSSSRDSQHRNSHHRTRKQPHSWTEPNTEDAILLFNSKIQEVSLIKTTTEREAVTLCSRSIEFKTVHTGALWGHIITTLWLIFMTLHTLTLPQNGHEDHGCTTCWKEISANPAQLIQDAFHPLLTQHTWGKGEQ